MQELFDAINQYVVECNCAMNPFGLILQSLYAARIAGALFDLGIDVKKLDRKTAAKLYQIEKESYNKESPCEAALWFFFVHVMELHKDAYLLPISLPDLLARAVVIVNLWAKNGKISHAEADRNIASLQMQIGMVNQGITVTTR